MKGIYCYVDTWYDIIVYIGKDSSIDKNKRHKQHHYPSNYDAHPINRILQNNPGRYEYRVLESGIETEEELNELEIAYIEKYDTYENWFNYTEGGENSPRYWLGKKGELHPMYGHKDSPETRAKKSKAQKGEKNSMYGKKGEEHPWYGEHHKEESKIKMSEAKIGKPLSEEHKMQTSKGKTSTGFYRVSKAIDERYKTGFRWRYMYYDENKKRKSIYSTVFLKLMVKVTLKDLPWRILDFDKAMDTLKKNNLIRMYK